jgi:Na+-driven multidrug efflux pump
LVSIVYSIFYYLIANNVIYIINSSKENPFVSENVKRFDKTGIYLIIVAILDFIKNHSNVLRADTDKISNVGFILLSGIICFVISNIIHKAIKIKDDNDLTI